MCILNVRTGLVFSPASSLATRRGEGHEREQEDHAQHLGAFHEFLARLAPRGNFVEEEEHVAAIEGGDGEDVDEGEHEGDEGR